MTVAIILGAVVGLIMGLTGAGGGILAVPLLIFVLHLTIAQAGPIALVAVGVGAALAAVIGLKKGIVRYRAAILVAVTGIVTAPIGVWLGHRLNIHLLSAIFAIVLLWVAYKSFRESRQSDMPTIPKAELPCHRDSTSGKFIWSFQCAARFSLAGLIAGVLSGLLGVGGGFVIVPVLQRYTDLTMQSVIATSLCVVALISMAGVFTSLSTGQLNISVATTFTAGAVAGLVVGGILSSRLSTKYLKLAFAIICFSAAAGMLLKLT